MYMRIALRSTCPEAQGFGGLNISRNLNLNINIELDLHIHIGRDIDRS